MDMSNSAQIERLKTDIEKIRKQLEALDKILPDDAGESSITTLYSHLHNLAQTAQAHAQETTNARDSFIGRLKELESDFDQRVSAWQSAVTTKIASDENANAWDEKGRDHTKAAGLLAYVIVILFALAIVLIGLIAGPRLDAAFGAADGSTGAFMLRIGTLAAAAIAIASLPIWGLRIVVRQFLTERRLAEDARGRAAMSRTLAGLALDPKFETDHRLVVLGAIYRPLPDIQIDDGSPVEILRAALQRGTTKET